MPGEGLTPSIPTHMVFSMQFGVVLQLALMARAVGLVAPETIAGLKCCSPRELLRSVS